MQKTFVLCLIFFSFFSAYLQSTLEEEVLRFESRMELHSWWDSGSASSDIAELQLSWKGFSQEDLQFVIDHFNNLQTLAIFSDIDFLKPLNLKNLEVLNLKTLILGSIWLDLINNALPFSIKTLILKDYAVVHGEEIYDNYISDWDTMKVRSAKMDALNRVLKIAGESEFLEKIQIDHTFFSQV